MGHPMNRTTIKAAAGLPSSAQLCRRLQGPAGQAYLQTLLEGVQAQQDLAYDCLRLARWGEGMTLRVVCPRCNKRAWSHSSSKGGKHRWRCVSKKMYAKQQRTKGYTSQGRSQHGCGFRFTDTTGTPFDHRSIPLGLVFLALYVPPTERNTVMASLGDSVTSANLRAVLKTLREQEHAHLCEGMQRLARRFCGEIILTHSGSHRTPIKRTPIVGKWPYRLQLPPVNPEKKPTVSDLSRLCETIQSLLDKIVRLEHTLQARLTDMQRRPYLRHTYLTEATVTPPRETLRLKRGAPG